ncbi:MAG: serine/threonine protein kinase, partial [Nannocystaceae bacterium]|nr:serine/threonine protein kinase [Nannocystaceae bacterium]
MAVTNDSTREDAELSPEAPPEGAGSRAMRAAIATQLFGDAAEPLRIGRYEVNQALGEGGMGVVYSAWDPSLGRHVALKLLSQGASGNDRRRRRMVREAQALAKLSHPNVVQVYEVGQHDDDVFVAMELVEGPSLCEWLQHAERSVREIEAVFVQAGRGLSAAHRADLVHRDFKPANVIVGTDGRVRVVDFGLAYGVGLTTESADPVSSSAAADRLTRTGAVMGTPAYMAPEQFRGGPADARADQFSFCVALFEALSGFRPYRPAELRDDPSQAEVSGWRSIPRSWRGPLTRGLQIAPSQRWPDIDSLLAVLQRRRVWQRRAPWLLAGGLGLATWAPSSPSIGPCDALPLGPRGWNEGRVRRIGRAFASTKAPFASDVWATARGSIDNFAVTWTETRKAVCRQEPRIESVRCLKRAEVVLESVLDQYEGVSADNVATIHPLSTLLETPTHCADPSPSLFGADMGVERLDDIVRARAELAANRPVAALRTLKA